MLEGPSLHPFHELGGARGFELRVIPWTEVSQEEGTGIVHIAPGWGVEDFILGKENYPGVAPIAPIDENGVFIVVFDWLTGKYAHKVGQPIADNPRENGLLLPAKPS